MTSYLWSTHETLGGIYLVQDSKAQVTALHLIIGTLQRTRVFGVENRDTLTHKATGVSFQLKINGNKHILLLFKFKLCRIVVGYLLSSLYSVFVVGSFYMMVIRLRKSVVCSCIVWTFLLLSVSQVSISCLNQCCYLGSH